MPPSFRFSTRQVSTENSPAFQWWEPSESRGSRVGTAETRCPRAFQSSLRDSNQCRRCCGRGANPRLLRGTPTAIALPPAWPALRPETGVFLQPTVYSPQPVPVYEPAFLAVTSKVRSAPSVETLNLISLPETWPL